MEIMILKEKLKQLPARPGVYLMRDSMGNIIYVGKAKNLKNRVSQYFHDQKDRDPKVVEMIQHIATFNYQVTDTELDALVEECRLIKEIKPRYNRQMKNFKKYTYLKIPKERYPKVTVVNEKTDDDGLYFGPFTSPHQVENVVQYLNEFYPIRKCSTPKLPKRVNGCLFRQLGTCLGACTGQVRPEEYWVHIEKILQLLKGSNEIPVQELLKMLDTAVKTLKFEKAAKYREYYLGLQHVIRKQQVIRSSSKNRNILAIEFLDSTYAKLFLIKGNKLLYGKTFNVVEAENIEIIQFLNQLIKDNFFVTDKNDLCSLTPQDIDEAQIIYSYLKKNKKRVISFWIPSTSLDSLVIKILTRIQITSKNMVLRNQA